MGKHCVLLVEDEPGTRFAMRDFLSCHNYDVFEAATCSQGEEYCRANSPDLVISDFQLPDGNALELLDRIKREEFTIPFILLTGHGSIELAVRAIKEGAEQFITKPVELPALLVIVERTLENVRNRKKQLASRSHASRTAVNPFLGTSRGIRALEHTARRVLDSDSPLLIQGATGTGKSVLAAWAHNNGSRSQEAFVDLNCAGLSRELVETELFGHTRGAFTGAVTSKMGLLEVAHRGTVFLDEIGDLDLQVQPKLLKVLEEKRFRRIGDVRDCSVDVRLIAATHQDLAARMREQKFRSDLYFRINTIPLTVPALCDRVEDIPVLAQRILDGLAAHLGRGQRHFSREAISALQSYGWPGNIRELKNVIERAILHTDREVISEKDLRFEVSFPLPSVRYDTNLTLRQLEKFHIQRVLEETCGQVEQAATRLEIPRSTLYVKLREYGIPTSKV